MLIDSQHGLQILVKNSAKWTTDTFTITNVCVRHFEPNFIYLSKRICRLAIPNLHIPALEKTLKIEPVAQSSSSIAELIPIMDEPTTSSATLSKKSFAHSARTHNRKGSASTYKSIIQDLKLLKRRTKKKLPAKKLRMKIEKSEAFKTLTQNMPEAGQIFFKMQLTQQQKLKKGRRFTYVEKVFALSLYKPAPKAYRILSKFCVLPSRRTL